MSDEDIMARARLAAHPDHPQSHDGYAQEQCTICYAQHEIEREGRAISLVRARLALRNPAPRLITDADWMRA